MASITLNYNTRNTNAQKILDFMLSLGVFKVQPISKVRRKAVRAESKDDIFLYSISEQTLAKDWLNKEEDEAWKNL